LIVLVLVDRETPLEFLQEATPIVVPPKELQSSVSENKKLAELGHLLEINIGEALGLGIDEV
jgi:hypothetical protein